MEYLGEQEKKAIIELKEALSKRYKLLEMRLFGSKARGPANWESDIDLYILMEDYDWGVEMEVCHLCFEIGLKYEVFLSPIIFSRKETEDRFIRATPFFKIIQREGIPL